MQLIYCSELTCIQKTRFSVSHFHSQCSEVIYKFSARENLQGIFSVIRTSYHYVFTFLFRYYCSLLAGAVCTLNFCLLLSHGRNSPHVLLPIGRFHGYLCPYYRDVHKASGRNSLRCSVCFPVLLLAVGSISLPYRSTTRSLCPLRRPSLPRNALTKVSQLASRMAHSIFLFFYRSLVVSLIVAASAPHLRLASSLADSFGLPALRPDLASFYTASLLPAVSAIPLALFAYS